MYDMYDRKPIGDGYTDAYIIENNNNNKQQSRPAPGIYHINMGLVHAL